MSVTSTTEFSIQPFSTIPFFTFILHFLLFADSRGAILDRAKDIVIRGGENIASAEVENAIYKDDRVAEAACVPVPCPKMGEQVGVAVSLAPGAQADSASISKVVEPRLRRVARPVIVLVLDEPLRKLDRVESWTNS